jgi:ABC-type branched-subunit amino acid transport system substrate-binding protein
VDRRLFLRSIAGSAAFAAGVRHARAAPMSPMLRVAYVAGGPGGTDGARLGADEAARAAALVGGSVMLTIGDDAARLLADRRPAVLVGGSDDEQGARLATLAADAGALFLNVGAAGDLLRNAPCRPHAFHVAASDRMRRDAAAGRDPHVVVLWHPSLERFGAAQLNDRFRARFGRAMDGDAWAAWMALKIATEAALRVGRADPADLAAHLVRPGVRFDGHKGVPLAFGAADHQLRQPLYVVDTGAGNAARVEEVMSPASPAGTPALAACPAGGAR